MKLREHRALFSDSMATTIEIPPTMEALKAVINTELGQFGYPEITADMIHVDPYYGLDTRNNWDTHIVSIKNYCVYGFTDGPLKETSC